MGWGGVEWLSTLYEAMNLSVLCTAQPYVHREFEVLSVDHIWAICVEKHPGKAFLFKSHIFYFLKHLLALMDKKRCFYPSPNIHKPTNIFTSKTVQ